LLDGGTFEDGVAEIEFTSGAYRIDVTDFDNPLLEDEEPDDENSAYAQPD
jgi:hypothetical protein